MSVALLVSLCILNGFSRRSLRMKVCLSYLIESSFEFCIELLNGFWVLINKFNWRDRCWIRLDFR